MSDEFTHFNQAGQPHMVDVGSKAVTKRVAIAKGRIFMATSTIDKLKNKDFAKGDGFKRCTNCRSARGKANC